MAHKATSELTSEETSVEIEIKYVKGSETRDADPIERDDELFEVTRDLACFGSDAFDEDLTVEEALDEAYVTIGIPTPVTADELGVDVDDPKAVAERVYELCQGGAIRDVVPYDGTVTRSMSAGDVVLVDGTPVMIEGIGTTVLDLDDA